MNAHVIRLSPLAVRVGPKASSRARLPWWWLGTLFQPHAMSTDDRPRRVVLAKKDSYMIPVRDCAAVELALRRMAASMGITFSEVRRRAYRLMVYGDPLVQIDRDGMPCKVGGGGQEHDDSVFPSSEMDHARDV